MITEKELGGVLDRFITYSDALSEANRAQPVVLDLCQLLVSIPSLRSVFRHCATTLSSLTQVDQVNKDGLINLTQQSLKSLQNNGSENVSCAATFERITAVCTVRGGFKGTEGRLQQH